MDSWELKVRKKFKHNFQFYFIFYLFNFYVSAAAENVDTIPLSSDVSTPPSDQLEVNAVAGNEVGVPAVLPVPKVMTPVGCLKEICVVKKVSIPKYQSKGEVPVANMTMFLMDVWVGDMNLRGILHPGISKIDFTV